MYLMRNHDVWIYVRCANSDPRIAFDRLYDLIDEAAGHGFLVRGTSFDHCSGNTLKAAGNDADTAGIGDSRSEGALCNPSHTALENRIFASEQFCNFCFHLNDSFLISDMDQYSMMMAA